MFLRHIPFLKSVTLYAFTAFGGPNGHIGMMLKTFVHKRKDLTEEELMDYNSFCQILPGPSSTQTIMLIALKRGGIPLALITLGLWIMPAFLLMSFFSFMIYYFDLKEIRTHLFSFIQPMSIGFMCFAAFKLMLGNIKNPATVAIMLGSLAAIVLIKTPWIFPLTMFLGGIVSNFSNNRIPKTVVKPKKINWANLWLFLLLFIVAGILSELARSHHWVYARIFNLFENFYRFGSIVFGGGQVLVGMMLYQFVQHPLALHHSPIISSETLLTGVGLVQAVPGPVFSLCTYVGGMAMSSFGWGWQLLGCIIATIAVFIPSTLMLFFFYPIYHNIKQHVILFRALEGINAAVVGIMWASAIVLYQSINTAIFDWKNILVILVTFFILLYTKLPSPFIVIGWLILGLLLNI